MTARRLANLNWALPNTTLLLLGVVLLWLMAQLPDVRAFIESLGYLGRLGALLAGVFFVSTYTVVPAGYVLFELAKYQNPLEVALFAGVGAMVGDFVIFRFVRDGVMEELQPHFLWIQRRPSVRQLFKTPYFAWLAPVVGAIIIASPLPDELGIGLLGASRMKSGTFLVLTYVLNVAGIFLIVLAARSLT
jgi:hypothetical protein